MGSLGAFWPLLEPVLEALAPRRLCEVGVEGGAFAAQLLAWCRPRGCRYVGVDPEPPADVPEVAGPDAAADGVVRGLSLDVLPRLDACDAYFLDGDHNYFTVRGELDAIARAAERRGGRGPLICVHDVGWPWGRRDMYYNPDGIPAEHRHPYSAELGVVLHTDELVDGGLRDPGRYAIACRAGGARNGVLTAVEDFVATPPRAGGAWEMLLVPAAFGLALRVPPRHGAAGMRAATAAVEHRRRVARRLSARRRAQLHGAVSVRRGHEGLRARAFGATFTALEHTPIRRKLQSAYGDLSAHAAALLEEYHKLAESHRRLESERAG